MSLDKTPSQFYSQRGYTDAYYGKDFLISVPKEYREAYLEGQNKFHKEFKECP